MIAYQHLICSSDHMLSLKTESDVLREIAESCRNIRRLVNDKRLKF